MNKLEIHIMAGCKPEPTNVINIKSKKRLVQCDCNQRFFVNPLDIASITR